MAWMLPLVGTATSVRRRFMGRPRCQTLAIAPLVTQRSRHRFLRRNPRQPQQACYFLDNQLGTYAVPSEFSVTAEFEAIARANAAFIESCVEATGRANDPSLGDGHGCRRRAHPPGAQPE
jgi:hypothetical protein